MSNEVMIPSGNAIPAHLVALFKANPSLLAINKDAAEGIGGGGHPTIVAVQGTFKTKVDGVETVIQINAGPELGMINAPKISAVILRAKKALDRAWFATSYVAGSEPASPDCSSEDGIKPKADSPNKQCESCAGCPQNMWGSAKKQDGTPGKGKACGEKKRIALFANNGIYRFNIPPASLGDFAAYAKQLEAHGLVLPAVITTISFDAAEPTKLVFSYQGVLNDAQAAKLFPMIDSPEVKAIIEDGIAPAATAPVAAQQPAQPAGPTAAEVEAEKKAAATKAAEEKKVKAAAAKKAKEEADKAAANIDLGMGDLGLGVEPTPAAAATGAASTAGPTDDDIAAALGI